nr:MAG: hypothetical protein DIU68_21625 [Chloroflexota bacterium]
MNSARSGLQPAAVCFQAAQPCEKALFVTVAMALAVIGLSGVMVYLVSQRTREIGVRLALGATRTKVFRTVVGRGAARPAPRPTLIVAASLTRLMEGPALLGLARTLFPQMAGNFRP